MVEDKIINNNYDSVEYGTESLRQTSIAISPLVSERYEDSISDNMEEVFVKRRLYEDLLEIYENSKYFQKYGKDYKKLEKADVSDIYYTFKAELKTKESYNLVDIFCAIAEFFDLNYKTLYNDIASLEDKAELLEILQENYGLERQFGKSKKLF
jgi:hypothetical protein